jgi:pilus assembly protein TadC
MALLPTSASIAQQRARAAEALFFLAALNGCLKTGLPLLSALATVAALLTTSLKVDLEKIYSLLLLGAEPIQAWSVLRNDPDLAPLARALPPAQIDGRSLAVVVERISTLCYENSVKRSRERVKSLSVKLALPVGLCFLPSFLIGGIGPIVYSFFTSLHIF